MPLGFIPSAVLKRARLAEVFKFNQNEVPIIVVSNLGDDEYLC